MRTLKAVLIAVVIAAVVLAALIGLFHKQLRAAQEKLRYGRVFSAVEAGRQRAAEGPENHEALSAYAEGLARKGNFGRARYLCELYGADSPTLEKLLPLLTRMQQDEAEGRATAVSDDALFAELAEEPAAQALRFAEGMHHALLGDWASAKNHFNFVETERLAPELRGLHQYYLARSYRFAGDETERGQVEEILKDLLKGDDEQFRARVESNLISWYADENFPGDGLPAAKQQVHSMEHGTVFGWPLSRACVDLVDALQRRGSSGDAEFFSMLAVMQAPLESPLSKTAGQQLMGILAIASENVALKDAIRRLAESSVQHDYAAEARKAIAIYGKQVKDPELRNAISMAVARCLRAEADAANLQALMARGNLEGWSDAAMGEIYFQYAELMTEQSKWNEALKYHQSAARLSAERAGESLFRRYWIIKKVKDPLNTQQAIDTLRPVVKDYKDSPAYPRAFEEIIPLLIFAGSSKSAAQLCDEALAQTELAAYPADHGRTLEELHEVALYWQAFMAEQDGRGSEAEELRGRIPLKYWNYYELVSLRPPAPDLYYSASPTVIEQPEDAGEYLAGLGLVDSAAEYYSERGAEDNQILLLHSLNKNAELRSEADRQYIASDYMERGLIRELPLLELALSEAYPRPWHDEALAAANRFSVPVALMYAIIKKESNFRSESVSWAGAVGLMQIMPETARFLKASYNMAENAASLKDPKTNLAFGAANLKLLFDQLGGGNLRGAIHGHNKGAGNYQKWQGLYPADELLFTDLVPNEENETFAKRVLRYFYVYDWLEARGAEE